MQQNYTYNKNLLGTHYQWNANTRQTDAPLDAIETGLAQWLLVQVVKQ